MRVRDIATYFMLLMIAGVIILLVSEYLTKQVCVCGGSFGDLTDCMRVYEMLCVGIYLNVLLHALRLSR